ncbi:MAG: IS4 family transposase, partial [Rhodospirillales bacterium]|nr:IS4 family transposase [Rhodospirillales bacterium]
MASEAELASVRRRFYRFFQYVRLDSATAARITVALLGIEGKPWVLAIDRTNWDFGRSAINILMISVEWHGIGIPLIWAILPKTGNSATAERILLFDRLAEAFPGMQVESLAGDREFIGEAWIAKLAARGIPFDLRLRENQYVRREGYAAMPIAIIAQNLKPGQSMILGAPCKLGKSGDAPALAIVILRLASGEFLAIATSGKPRHALARYRRRWRIETLFANLKTKGFNLEDTHLTDPAKLATLLGLLAIAVALSAKTGAKHVAAKPIPVKKHGRPAASLFAHGRAILCKLLATRDIPRLRRKLPQLLGLRSNPGVPEIGKSKQSRVRWSKFFKELQFSGCIRSILVYHSWRSRFGWRYSMGKNIILLSDGTGNSAAKFNKTNVWRTYEALDLSDPGKQIAAYDDGVGTSTFAPLALAGGAIGLGLSRNVRQLYAFLCQNYQPDDQIYGFGFSRGAFTIRTLAGFVATQGIMKRGLWKDDQDLWRKTTWLYRQYRKEHSARGQEPWLSRIVRSVRDRLPFQAMTNAQHVTGPGDPKPLNPTNIHDAKIEFLGLWDTVDAYGLPMDEMTAGWDRYVWPLSMRSYDLSNKVKRAAHALCLDDERNTFHPLLWNEAAETGQKRLKQVWFAGMHADVGGGYANDSLSLVPLNWVLDEAGADILFDRIKRDALRAGSRYMGEVHNSRRGLQSYYRLQPRKLERLLHTASSHISFSARKLPTQTKSRVVRIDRPIIHHSVFDRIGASKGAYSPIVLPKNYDVLTASGQILAPDKFRGTPDTMPEDRAFAQERVWDIVWLRRVAYFATLFVTVNLALLPWMPSIPYLSSLWPMSEAVVGDKCINSSFCFLSGLPKLGAAFLPGFAQTWVDSFSTNPGVFGGLAAAIGVLMWLSSYLDAKIRSRMQNIWFSQTLDTSRSGLTKFRESRAYTGLWKFLKGEVFPASFGLAALSLVLASVPVTASRVWFSWTDARGDHCENSGGKPPLGYDYSAALDFNSGDPCWPTGLGLQKGGVYRVVMDITKVKDNWKDG